VPWPGWISDDHVRYYGQVGILVIQVGILVIQVGIQLIS
jgi:hypothetical protein